MKHLGRTVADWMGTVVTSLASGLTHLANKMSFVKVITSSVNLSKCFVSFRAWSLCVLDGPNLTVNLDGSKIKTVSFQVFSVYSNKVIKELTPGCSGK